jgi:hypothetical protein
MSNYGFFAKNDSGFVQVDGTYDNVAVVLEGTIMANYWTGYAPELGYFYGQTFYPQPSINRAGVSTFAALQEVVVPQSIPDDYLVFARPSPETTNLGMYYPDVAGSDQIFVDRHFCMTHAPSMIRQYGYTTNTEFWNADSHKFYFFAPLVMDYLYIVAQPQRIFTVDYKVCIRSRDMAATPAEGYGIKVFKNNGEESYSSKNKNFRMTHTIDQRDIAAPATPENTFGGVGFDAQGVAIPADDFDNTYALMNGRHPCHIQNYYAPTTIGSILTVGSSVTWSYGPKFYKTLNVIVEGPFETMWGPYFTNVPFRSHLLTGIFGKFT